MAYRHGRKVDALASGRMRRWAALGSGVGLLVLATHARAAEATAVVNRTGEVVVTAPREEIQARVVQMRAPNLISVQSAETIAKYPDFNAAESLGRMPGISLSTDTGEGRFVNIRGIDGNLDGATFGGVPLLNTNPGGTYFSGGGRAVEFDTIPGGAIDGLIVTYTGLPDHEAEGLGGSVELTPRSAAHLDKPFIDGTLGWGYEPEHKHDGPLDFDLAFGGRFGFDNGHPNVEGVDKPAEPRVGFFSNPTPFSFVLTGSVRSDRRGFDDIDEGYNSPGTSDRSYSDIEFRRYDYHRIRFAYGGEFDFTPNEDHRYYIRANVAGYDETVKKNRLAFNFATTTPDGSGFTDPAALVVSSTDEEEIHKNQIFVVGGQDQFGDVALDYHASYSTASYDQIRNVGADFGGPTVATMYDNSANNGDFPKIAVTDGTNINDPSLYSLSDATNSQEHDLDQEYTVASNLQFPVRLFNDDDRLKVGFEVRLRSKTQRIYNNNGIGGMGIVLPPLSLAGLSSPADTNFYDNGYTNGPDVDILGLRSLVEAAQGPLVFDPSQYFSARENIYAGYGEYTARIGKFGLLAGVRVEATDADYGNYEVDADGHPIIVNNQAVFVDNPKRYTNVFPTVQLRYDFTPKLVLRATYSTGIGRPGFNQIAGAITIDTSNGVITEGNPSLQPTTGNSFDLDLEYYLPNGGILQVGAFDKEFSNYIVTEKRFVPTDPRIPGFGAPIEIDTFANINTAYARGLEAAYHQQFSFLPAPFDGLGVESNLTLVDSRLQEYDAATTGTGHAEYGPLPGTSRVSANLAGFYEAHGVQLRLSAEYVSPELFKLGGSKASDTIQDARLTLDFASSYAFNQNWTVYFNVKNLLNSPLRFYVGDPSFPIQREFYDVTYEAGIKVHF